MKKRCKFLVVILVAFLVMPTATIRVEAREASVVPGLYYLKKSGEKYFFQKDYADPKVFLKLEFPEDVFSVEILDVKGEEILIKGGPLIAKYALDTEASTVISDSAIECKLVEDSLYFFDWNHEEYRWSWSTNLVEGTGKNIYTYENIDLPVMKDFQDAYMENNYKGLLYNIEERAIYSITDTSLTKVASDVQDCYEKNGVLYWIDTQYNGYTAAWEENEILEVKEDVVGISKVRDEGIGFITKPNDPRAEWVGDVYFGEPWRYNGYTILK